jgi:iron complex outermembrane receptor protein
MHTITHTLTAGLVLFAALPVLAEPTPPNATQLAPQLEELRVLGTATLGQPLNTDALPFVVQRFDTEDLSSSALYSAVAVLENQATSVTTHAAQNNRLQPDIQYRGFVASPLLGLSQGLSVYQNGVRLNEAFGDTVNWDLLPASSMASLEIIGGANPAFGLNSIGGSLRLLTHTGFSQQGGSLAATFGRYGARDYTVQWGGQAGDWGGFLAIDAMEESGWRDYSDSRAASTYGALSWRGADSELDLFLNVADTRLKGNGAVPEALLATRRQSVFTHPDQTENALAMSSVSFRRQFATHRLDITAFYRDSDTVTFNGDGSEYEACLESDDDNAPENEGDVAEEDARSGPEAYAGYLCDEDDAPVMDKRGRWVSDRYNAVNNRSRRLQQSMGVTVQWSRNAVFQGVEHQLAFGGELYQGDTTFRSTTELAELTASRGTTLTNIYDANGDTFLDTQRKTVSLFASNHAELTQTLAAHAAVRYHRTRLQGNDPSGQRPELAGDHRFEDLNASLGLLWRGHDTWELYANGQTAVRTPTPVELACAHPDAPCRLPNAFLADPPLDATKALSLELGIRGQWQFIDHYRVGVFSITVDDDIIFQTTGGVSSNQGFFQNATDTARQGLELEIQASNEHLQGYLRYSYTEATFEKAFTSSSPNNPQAVNGVLQVSPGDSIPLTPRHNLKAGLGWKLSPRLRAGIDYRYQSGVYLRGDEANVDSKTRSAAVVDIHAQAEIGQNLFVELRMENALNARYETFGLYGEADEVLDDIDDDSGRFLGPASPPMLWFTVGWSW